MTSTTTTRRDSTNTSSERTPPPPATMTSVGEDGVDEQQQMNNATGSGEGENDAAVVGGQEVGDEAEDAMEEEDQEILDELDEVEDDELGGVQHQHQQPTSSGSLSKNLKNDHMSKSLQPGYLLTQVNFPFSCF